MQTLVVFRAGPLEVFMPANYFCLHGGRVQHLYDMRSRNFPVMKPPCVAAVAHLLAFHVLVSATEPVHSQSKTSCLMQHRADASKWLDAKEIAQDSPFSDEQRHCIREYASSVDADIPGFAGQLAHRKFGGAGAAATNDSVILGAGFGTTATRSLFTFAAQLGRRVHHWSSAADPPEFWTQLNGLVSKKHPDGASGCYKAVNAMNFSASLAGHDMLLDTPLAEHFLDFYAVSPNSKVVLTTRRAADWVKSRMQFDRTLPVPLHSPCGMSLEEIGFDVAVRLYEAHERLVRCIVPAAKLTEINVFEAPVNVTALIDFFGWPQPEFVPLYPRIGGEDSRYDEENFLICITGQIRRLELKTKVERLFLPLAQAGFTVLVALVLDVRSDSKYINRPAGELHGNYTVTDGNFTTLQQAAEMFPKSIYLIGDPFLPHDYPPDERYVRGLYEAFPEKGQQRAADRAKSHMRQWEALDRCAQLPWPDAKYTMRLRDDDAIMQPFVLPSMLEENTLYAPQCNPCYGLNDKFALAVGRGTADAYFRLPLQTVRSDFDRLQQELEPLLHRSPEQVLATVLSMHGIAVKLMDASGLPILPAKNMRKGSKTYLCYYAGSEGYRDCMSEEITGRLISEGFQIEQSADYPWHSFPEFYCEKEAQRFVLQP